MKLLLQDFIQPEAWAHLGSHVIPPEQRHRPHTHDFHEVFWITQGTALHEWENGTVQMLPGDCQSIPAEVSHRVVVQGAQPVSLKVLAFAPPLLTGALKPETGWFNSNTELAPVHLPPSHLEQLEQQCHLFNELECNQLSTLTFLYLLKSMMTCVSRLYTDPVPPWLIELRTVMMKPDHLIEGLPALLTLSGKSQSYLCRQWKQAFGESPTQFINRERIKLAQEKLVQSQEAVSKIAMEVGFHETSYFFRQFQRFTQCTPLEYRSRQRRSF